VGRRRRGDRGDGGLPRLGRDPHDSLDGRDRGGAALILKPLAAADRAAIESWSYPPPYDTYNHDEPIVGDYLAAFEGDELIGYVCFGEPARVDGMKHEPDLVDVGWGLRPDLLGRGLGPALIEAALAVHPGARHRIAVLAWNERARRAPAKCGFVETAELGEFVLMER
jgi:ribosomal-protein-alanine N-acetyltransferase